MKHFLSIFISLTFVIGRLQYISAQDDHFNVMTFNLRYPNPGDSSHYWDNRRPLVKSILQFHEVDLLGVQEAHRRQINEIIADIPDFDWFGVCRADGSTDPHPDCEFSAILYRKDRFERLDGNTFWLSEQPEKVGSVGWDAALPRIVTWAKFKDKISGRIFFHFNTHFDHMGVTARNESAKLLQKKVADIAGNNPVIITGDFNCSDIDTPYKILTDPVSSIHFTDAMTVSKIPHHGPMASFAGSFKITDLIEHRIDFIFIRHHVEIFRHAIISDTWNGNMASDHLPVFAEVKIH